MNPVARKRETPTGMNPVARKLRTLCRAVADGDADGGVEQASGAAGVHFGFRAG